MSVTIRVAIKHDAERLHQLAKLALENQYDGTSLASETLPARLIERVYTVEAFQQALESDHRQLLVAEKASEIIGMCQYGIPLMDDCDCEDLREIHALFLHPQKADTEVGFALVTALENSINADATVQRLSVFVNPILMATVKFYAKLGFHHDAAEDIGDEWYMEKNL